MDLRNKSGPRGTAFSSYSNVMSSTKSTGQTTLSESKSTTSSTYTQALATSQQRFSLGAGSTSIPVHRNVPTEKSFTSYKPNYNSADKAKERSTPTTLRPISVSNKNSHSLGNLNTPFERPANIGNTPAGESIANPFTESTSNSTSNLSYKQLSEKNRKGYPVPEGKPPSFVQPTGNQIEKSEERSDEEYPSEFKKFRGVGIIFNHITFEPDLKLSKRKGTDKDCEQLRNIFKELNFKIEVYVDKKRREIQDILKQAADKDHSGYSCFLVFVLSHGDDNTVYAHDGLYPELGSFFTADKCQTLVGKPKLFFTQACGGAQRDPGFEVSKDTTDSVPFKYQYDKKPNAADMIFAYSTIKDYVSVRNEEEGTWYVQELCEEFRSNGRKRDLQTMLTFVNGRVSSRSSDRVHHIQMPYFSSTLTKLLFFRDPPKRKKTFLWLH